MFIPVVASMLPIRLLNSKRRQAFGTSWFNNIFRPLRLAIRQKNIQKWNPMSQHPRIISVTESDRCGASTTGSTKTSRSYSIFGCVILLGLGFFMGGLYGLVQGGNFWIPFYDLLLSGSLFVIPESTRIIVTLSFLFLLTWFIVRPKKIWSSRACQIRNPNATVC